MQATFTNSPPSSGRECVFYDVQLIQPYGADLSLVEPIPASGTVIGLNESLSVGVRFAPAVPRDYYDAGPVACKYRSDDNHLRVSTSATRAAINVGLRGGAIAKPVCEVAGDIIDFGPVPTGCSTDSRIIKIYNNNIRAMAVNAVQATSPFSASLRLGPAPQEVLPNGSAQIAVRFTPSEAGPRTGTLTATADDGSTLCNEVTLKGEGITGAVADEVFYQAAENPVDILWCMDGSGSMLSKQAEAAAAAPEFIAALAAAGVDYHIGVAAAAIGPYATQGTTWLAPGWLLAEPGYPKIITTAAPDPGAALAANLGTFLEDIMEESCLESLRLAVGGVYANDPERNAGFLRPGAKLMLVIVSDEDDQSLLPVEYYREFFWYMSGVRDPEALSVNVIAGLAPETLDPGCFLAREPGERYREFYGITGNGVLASICGPNWPQLMGDLGRKAASLAAPQTRFRLRNSPLSEPDDVAINGVSVPRGGETGWEYHSNANTVVFAPAAVPPLGAEIRVSYVPLCPEP